jgi:glucose-6-phosphate 1-epimerase
VYSQSPSVPIEVSEGGKKILEVRRDNLEHVVVWNPWIEKAKGMGDFEPKDGWKKMVCVEAGQVLGWQRLEAGDTFEGSQFVRGF